MDMQGIDFTFSRSNKLDLYFISIKNETIAFRNLDEIT